MFRAIQSSREHLHWSQKNEKSCSDPRRSIERAKNGNRANKKTFCREGNIEQKTEKSRRNERRREKIVIADTVVNHERRCSHRSKNRTVTRVSASSASASPDDDENDENDEKNDDDKRMPWERKEIEKMRAVKYSQKRPEMEQKKRSADEEYLKLKDDLKQLTIKFGAALTAYSLLGYGVANAISAMYGSVGSVLYLQFLSEYVDTMNEQRDGYKEDEYTRNLVYEPVTDVGELVFGKGSVIGKIVQIYKRALFQKRLAVPCALVITESLWNHIPMHPFDLNYGVTLLGFLTYKASALTITYTTLKPLLADDAKNAGNFSANDDDDE